jgi:eukaryotic-like serine/threonine-protein kinase
VKPTSDRTDIQPNSNGEDPRLFQAVQHYLTELEAGRRPGRAKFAALYPDIAEQLNPYLEALDLVHATVPQTHPPPMATSAADQLPAEPIGDFRIMREIGRGGMGTVYEAEQLSLRRCVALKVLPFAAALDPKQLVRFQNEALAAAQLHHTNIVPVYAVGCERGVHYYAMQLIEGQNLADLIRQLRLRGGLEPQGPTASDRRRPGVEPAMSMSAPSEDTHQLTVADVAAELSTLRTTRSESYFRTVISLVAQAADALDHAHQFGVIHRDVKPANLIVDDRRNLWVTDFGLAQFHAAATLTRTGDILGTLRYMSPEQAAGHGTLLDARTDIYSLGATLYELLTLEPLFGGNDHRQLLNLILNEEPTRPRELSPSLPLELETVVLKAVSKTPVDRYGSAREFGDDLRRFLENRPVLARRPTWTQRARKWGRRHPSLIGASIVLLVLLTASSLVSAGLIRAAYDRERHRAEEAEERFRLARRSVDEMIQVSEEELAGKPYLDGLRRRLLESALVYYQEFIEQRRDDPAAQADLHATKDRVRQILNNLALLQGAGQFDLLRVPAVLEDLQATESQRQSIADLSGHRDSQHMELFREFRRLTSEEREQRFLTLAREDDTSIRRILGSEQVRRLHQIALQAQGPGAFRDTDVVAALKLTSRQKERIRAIEESFLGGPHGPRPVDLSEDKILQQSLVKERDEKRRGARAQLLEVLTPEQLQRWRDLTGQPYDGPVPLLKMFGPPGPRH